WVNFYGMSSTLNGAPLPIGSVVQAWTGGTVCGSFVVHTLGWYGLLPCYRAFDGSPGAQPGDLITFTVNGLPAAALGPDQAFWTQHGDRKQVELQAVGAPPTATATVIPPTSTTVPPTATGTPQTPWPTPTRTFTPIAPWTPWPTPWWPTPGPTPWWPTPGPTPIAPGPATPAVPCWEGVANSNFLTNDGWIISPDARPAIYTVDRWYTGGRSMFLGNMTQPDTTSHSAIRQVVEIPANATSARLRFWYWPWSEDTTGNDHQELALLDPATGLTIWTPWHRVRANEQTWLSDEINLTAYRGRRLELYFNVANDGSGKRTAMYLDGVSLTICTAAVPPPATATPTPSPTWPVGPTAAPATPPAIPPGDCTELVKNPSFDPGLNAWQLGQTWYTPRYASEQYRSSPWSIYLGFQPALSDRASWSSVRQTVQIPSNVDSVTLYFWYFPIAEAGGGQDQQQFVLLDPWNEEVVAVPWRGQSNAQSWQLQAADLTPYRGRSLSIYFNVVNDGIGGRMGMYLDDVSVLACTAAPPTALAPAALPSTTATTAAAAATDSPSETPGAAATPLSQATTSAGPTVVSVIAQTPTTLVQQPTAPSTTGPSGDVRSGGAVPLAPTQASRTSTSQFLVYGLLGVVLVGIAGAVGLRLLR
ncbi:MAG: hypothetical protein GX605_06985, partial [Chloroflexi bacterium]|nr:hypothetical protein [Chloroflexota bacterium]